ncbi:hypothetical protein, partial [Kitasatospora sp. MBT63]|uniref:hypothetical protein n=1 Tax=Kitasatospora sp. MBT63 TaxID=1444768 RepID=UPI0007C7260D
MPRPYLRTAARALREHPGWPVLVAGLLLCLLGWYGVSGESLTARQLPYLASATAPGTALVAAGALLLGNRAPGPRDRPADPRIDQLYALLTDGTDPRPDTAPAPAGPLLAVPEGTLYHRPDCALVAGKPQAVPVDAATVRERALTPCPVCDPGPP